MEKEQAKQSQQTYGKENDSIYIQAEKNHKKSQNILSQHSNNYNAQLARFHLKVSEEFQGLKQKLEKSWIVSKKGKFCREFQVKIKSSTINREVIVFSLKWGCFECEAAVLNVEGYSKTHKCQAVAAHLSCDIYKIATNNAKPQVVKCIKSQKNRCRIAVLKQWFLTKIGSVLGFGPRLSEQFGFDIIVYKKCSQFAMEMCQKTSFQLQRMQQQLLYKLAVMHHFKIVHQDIKPQNIMWSRLLKEFVLIDFGLSKMVEQQMGFKSATTFVGSTSFCSEDMLSCFYSRQKVSLDLYYNDLCSLNQSVSYLVDGKIVQDQNSDDQYIFKLPEDAELGCGWITLYLAKFLLFRQKIGEMKIIWPKIVENKLVTSVILFLKELMPTKKIQSFFDQFISDSQAQTIIYSEVEQVYKNANQKVFCPIFLVQEDKLKNFASFYQDINLQKSFSLGKSNKDRQKYVKKLVNDSQQVKKVSYLSYVKAYLQYVSYMNNVYRVDANDRQIASKIYILCHMSQDELKLQDSSTHSRLINCTIQHILNRILKEPTESAEEFVEKSFILFDIYDFLVVLGLGIKQKFLKWLDQICKYLILIPTLGTIFMRKVSWSLVLISKRIVFQGDSKEISTLIRQVNIWQRQVHNTTIEVDDKLKQQTAQIATMINQKLCNQQLFEESWLFDQQIKNIQNFHRLQGQIQDQHFQKIQELYLSLKHRKQFKRVYYFLFELYDKYFSSLNRDLSKNVYNIVKDNFNDPSLLEQFVFDFQITTVARLMVSKTFEEYFQALCKMNDFYLRLEGRDLLLHSKTIYIAFNSLLIWRDISEGYHQLFKDQQTQFIQKFVDALTFFLKNIVLEDKQTCFSFWIVLQSLNMIYTIRAQKNEALLEFIEEKSQFFCQQCQQALYFGIKLYLLHISMLQITCKFIKNKHQPACQILSKNRVQFERFYELRAEINNRLKTTKLFFGYKKIIGVINFYYSFLLCCNDLSVENVYHGIYGFFKYAYQSGNLRMYIQPQLQFFKYITKTLQTLQIHSQSQYFDFLYQLIEVIAEKQYRHYAHPIYSFYLQYVSKRVQSDLIKQYLKIEKYLKSKIVINPYFAIVFLVLLNLMKDLKYKRKAMLAIAKLINHTLIGSIKTLLIVNIYYFTWLNLAAKCGANKRKSTYLTKKIVKLVMNQWGSEESRTERRDFTCRKRKCLNSKLRRLQKVRLSGTTHYFYYHLQ